jgi:hypothetical protein
MRHIFHTCLLGLRLISSVDSVNAKTETYSFFNNEFLDEAYRWVFSPQVEEKKHFAAATYYVDAVQQTAA